MQKTFFYTQIKQNDFNKLKESCLPFSKDIFSANQEHIVAFDDSKKACKAALNFLNQIYNQKTQYDYKIVLVQGMFLEDRPEELSVRVARSIHQHSGAKNLYFTEEILKQIDSDDIEFEKKGPLFIKALQKEIPTFSLLRFEESQLFLDPTDLFDFSQVDSHASIPAKNIDMEALEKKIDSSNEVLELDTQHKYNTDPVVSSHGIISPEDPEPIPSSPRIYSDVVTKAKETKKFESQFKSIAILSVLVIIVTASGFYLTRSTQPSKTSETAPLPLPEIQPEATPQITQSKPEPIVSPTRVIPDTPVAKIATISIHSEPNGAEVWINGKKQKGKTPINKLRYEPDFPLKIDVEKPGFQKASKRLSLSPKETRTVMFQLSSPTKTISKTSSKTIAKKTAAKPVIKKTVKKK